MRHVIAITSRAICNINQRQRRRRQRAIRWSLMDFPISGTLRPTARVAYLSLSAWSDICDSSLGPSPGRFNDFQRCSRFWKPNGNGCTELPSLYSSADEESPPVPDRPRCESHVYSSINRRLGSLQTPAKITATTEVWCEMVQDPSTASVLNYKM